MWKGTKKRTECESDSTLGQKCLNFAVYGRVLLGQRQQKHHVVHWKSGFIFTECGVGMEGIIVSALYQQNWDKSINVNFH